MDRFAGRILDWHRAHGRHDLPWQRARHPYGVWVSEIMLQQTQVATVIPYYTRFMQRFPALEHLAAAEQDHVLGSWSGLGYYARARNLHRAAQVAVERHGGRLPETLDELMALPGIGRSTAGAILALAHGRRFAILDGNVKRVLARYHAVEGWAGRAEVARRLWELAERHTPEARVADYTQGVMDLGATICTRARPSCDACPVAEGCRARAAGSQSLLPAPRPPRVRPRRRVRVLVVRDAARGVLLERRPENGVWGGLYSLPELPEDTTVEAWCARELGAVPRHQRALEIIEHAFTHFDLELEPVLVEPAPVESPRAESARAASRGAVMDRSGRLWYKRSQGAEVGTAAPIAALLERLLDKTSDESPDGFPDESAIRSSKRRTA